MNTFRNNIRENLAILKKEFQACAIKSEFEAEGASVEETSILKEIAEELNLDLAIKIGGCEAITDLTFAKDLDAKIVVAPMIETVYALKKYVNSIQELYTEQQRANKKFLINIETITGYNNYLQMVQSEDFNFIDGIVIGRTDLVSSMGLSSEDVNSARLADITNNLILKTKEYNKIVIVGGGISKNSVEFFRKLKYLPDYVETRKIIFDTHSLINNNSMEGGILKALRFELLWLKNKEEITGSSNPQNQKRIELIEKRYKKMLSEVCGSYV